jgi:two-component system cell cycle response regulator DivK
MPTILLVEDNEMNRDMLSRRLIRKGFHVLTAVDGQEGVDMAVQEKPDLILMDMSLPVLDGWAATRLLKSMSDLQSIPIIALTAHAMKGDEEEAYRAGCDDFDTKPVVIDRLLDKIQVNLERSGTAKSTDDGSMRDRHIMLNGE